MGSVFESGPNQKFLYFTSLAKARRDRWTEWGYTFGAVGCWTAQERKELAQQKRDLLAKVLVSLLSLGLVFRLLYQQFLGHPRLPKVEEVRSGPIRKIGPRRRTENHETSGIASI